MFYDNGIIYVINGNDYKVYMYSYLTKKLISSFDIDKTLFPTSSLIFKGIAGAGNHLFILDENGFVYVCDRFGTPKPHMCFTFKGIAKGRGRGLGDGDFTGIDIIGDVLYIIGIGNVIVKAKILFNSQQWFYDRTGVTNLTKPGWRLIGQTRPHEFEATSSSGTQLPIGGKDGDIFDHIIKKGTLQPLDPIFLGSLVYNA